MGKRSRLKMTGLPPEGRIERAVENVKALRRMNLKMRELKRKRRAEEIALMFSGV